MFSRELQVPGLPAKVHYSAAQQPVYAPRIPQPNIGSLNAVERTHVQSEQRTALGQDQQLYQVRFLDTSVHLLAASAILMETVLRLELIAFDILGTLSLCCLVGLTLQLEHCWHGAWQPAQSNPGSRCSTGTGPAMISAAVPPQETCLLLTDLHTRIQPCCG